MTWLVNGMALSSEPGGRLLLWRSGRGQEHVAMTECEFGERFAEAERVLGEQRTDAPFLRFVYNSVKFSRVEG